MAREDREWGERMRLQRGYASSSFSAAAAAAEPGGGKKRMLPSRRG